MLWEHYRLAQRNDLIAAWQKGSPAMETLQDVIRDYSDFIYTLPRTLASVAQKQGPAFAADLAYKIYEIAKRAENSGLRNSAALAFIRQFPDANDAAGTNLIHLQTIFETYNKGEPSYVRALARDLLDEYNAEAEIIYGPHQPEGTIRLTARPVPPVTAGGANHPVGPNL